MQWLTECVLISQGEEVWMEGAVSKYFVLIFQQFSTVFTGYFTFRKYFLPKTGGEEMKSMICLNVYAVFYCLYLIFYH